MNAEALVQGEYLKAAVIGSSTPTYTIKTASLEKLPSLKPGASEGKLVNKGIVWFTDCDQGWVMNQTNKQCLVGLWGLDTELWEGKRVTLCTENTNTGPGIRVKGSPDIDEPVTVMVKLPKKKPKPYTLVPTGNRRQNGPTPYATFVATLAAKNIDAEALGAWWAETNPADGHPRTWVRGLAEFAADVCADGSPILASFRAAGGGK